MLFNGVFDLAYDLFHRLIFVIYNQRLLDLERLQDTSFLDAEALLVKRSSETIDDNRNDNRLVLLDDMGCAFTDWLKRLGSTLRKRDNPAVPEGDPDIFGVGCDSDRDDAQSCQRDDCGACGPDERLAVDIPVQLLVYLMSSNDVSW